MSTLELKELSHPAGEVIKIAAGKTLDLKSQGSVTMPTGSVLQVLSTTESVSYSTTTSDWSARMTGLSATITPSSTTSKILVSVNTGLSFQHNNTYGKMAIYRSISGGATTTNLTGEAGGFGNAGNGAYAFYVNADYLDSPSSVSAITYSVSFAFSAGGVGVVYAGANDASSTITLMEIQG